MSKDNVYPQCTKECHSLRDAYNCSKRDWLLSKYDPDDADAAGLHVADAIEVGSRLSKELRTNKGCDIVIALTHAA